MRACQPRAGPIDACERLRDLVFADNQRRQQPNHIVAGGNRDHLLIAQFVHHLGCRRHHAQADQKAFAALPWSGLSLRPPRLCWSTVYFFPPRWRKPFAVITSSAALPAAIASGL